MLNPQDAPGLELSKAFEHYSHPQLFRRYQETSKGIKKLTPADGLSDFMRGQPARDQSYTRLMERQQQDAIGAIGKDLESKIFDQRLIVIGFVSGPNGRNPDKPRQKISDDLLDPRKLKINWRDETVSGNGLSYVNVRLVPYFDTPEFATTLVGCSLSECFKRMMEGDWRIRELAEVAFESRPDMQFDLLAKTPWNPEYRQARFEEWPDCEDLQARIRSQKGTSPKSQPAPPEEIVALGRRMEELVRHLINWLRNGVIDAEGIAGQNGTGSKRDVTPREFWSDPDSEIGFTNNRLRRITASKRRIVYSDVRIAEPASMPLEYDEDERAKGLAPPKGKAGRKPRWDWVSAGRELMRLANSPDGLPPDQADIERYMIEWFEEKFGESPSVSQIRKFIVERLPPDYRQNN